jgi:alpha-N-acetylglucosamine transferase
MSKSTKKEFAFCIIHFGSNSIYLEYEIYTILMLKKCSIYDIVYLYSINDTPSEFVKIIESFDVIVQGYDDSNITYNIQDSQFISTYQHFNTLRTCNYMFALNLTKYKKVCIIESDMVIMKNIDPIFSLKAPAILYYLDEKNITKNKKINRTCEDLFEYSATKGIGGIVNGGLMLFKPSKKLFKESVQKMQFVIKKNCKYPNESLFLYTMKDLYNLPILYNLTQYYIDKYKSIKDDVVVFHFNNSQFKPLDFIKDDYINKNKKEIRRNIVYFFKKNYYDPYHEFVEKKMKKNLSNEYRK